MEKRPYKSIILTAGRTGSTLLQKALEGHSQLKYTGEILCGHISGIPTRQLAEQLFGITLKGKELSDEDRTIITDSLYIDEVLKKYDGFKLLYYHLTRIPNGVGHYLRARNDILIIHLRRHNLFKRYVSQAVASRNRQWFRQPKRPFIDESPIMVDVDDFLKSSRYLTRTAAYFDAFFSGRIMTIYYEDIVAEWDKNMKLIQDYLGVPREKLPIAVAKVITKPINEMVINYEEIKEYCQDTELAYCFTTSNTPRQAASKNILKRLLRETSRAFGRSIER